MTTAVMTLLHFLIFLASAACAFFIPSFGNLTSENGVTLYYVGENMTLHCYKNTDFSENVTFLFGNVKVDAKYVTKINSTYIVMRKPVTSEDFEQTIYQCNDSSTPLIAVRTIFTDYQPRNASDFEFIFMNKSELFFKWKFGNTTYKHGNFCSIINVTAEWSFNPFSGNSVSSVCYSGSVNFRDCNSNSMFGASCTVPMYNLHANIYVRINITNVKRQDIVSTVFSAGPVVNYAKPSPVKRVVVEPLNSTAVKLTVETDVIGLLTYNITYYTMDGDKKAFTELKSSGKSWQLNGLHPSYTYHFEVRTKFDTGYESDLPTVIPTQTMPEDAPSSAPVIEPGSYFFDKSYCLMNNAGNVYIYYQEVAEEDKNGIIIKYTAEITTDGETKTFWTTGASRTLKIESVPCKKGFNASVYATNRAGKSPSVALQIPAWDEDFKQTIDGRNLMVRVNANGSVTFEWQSISSSEGISLCVYYCTKDKQDDKICEDAIQTVKVDAEAGQYTLASAYDSDFKFGIGGVSVDRISGIRFTNCIYNPQKDSGRPPVLQLLSKKDGIVVSWPYQEQCSTSSLIILLNYEIEVCSILTHSDCKTETVAISQSKFEFDSAEQRTNYSFRIRANTTSGLTPFSDHLFAEVDPPVKGANVPEIIGIAMGVLLGVLILGSVVFCVVKRYKDNESKFKLIIDDSFPQPDSLETASTTDSCENPQFGSLQKLQPNSEDSGYSELLPKAYEQDKNTSVNGTAENCDYLKVENIGDANYLTSSVVDDLNTLVMTPCLSEQNIQPPEAVVFTVHQPAIDIIEDCPSWSDDVKGEEMQSELPDGRVSANPLENSNLPDAGNNCCSGGGKRAPLGSDYVRHVDKKAEKRAPLGSDYVRHGDEKAEKRAPLGSDYVRHGDEKAEKRAPLGSDYVRHGDEKAEKRAPLGSDYVRHVDKKAEKKAPLGSDYVRRVEEIDSERPEGYMRVSVQHDLATGDEERETVEDQEVNLALAPGLTDQNLVIAASSNYLPHTTLPSTAPPPPHLPTAFVESDDDSADDVEDIEAVVDHPNLQLPVVSVKNEDVAVFVRKGSDSGLSHMSDHSGSSGSSNVPCINLQRLSPVSDHSPTTTEVGKQSDPGSRKVIRFDSGYFSPSAGNLEPSWRENNSVSHVGNPISTQKVGGYVCVAEIAQDSEVKTLQKISEDSLHEKSNETQSKKSETTQKETGSSYGEHEEGAREVVQNAQQMLLLSSGYVDRNRLPSTVC